MNDKIDKHWTEDADTLEEFVLNRMSSSNRATLEAHLRICEVCQHAVRTEQEIIGGIRKFGRDSLKSRLARRIPEEERTPWLHIVSAAAIVLIIAGIGIYSRWRAVHEQPVTPPREVSISAFDSAAADVEHPARDQDARISEEGASETTDGMTQRPKLAKKTPLKGKEDVAISVQRENTPASGTSEPPTLGAETELAGRDEQVADQSLTKAKETKDQGAEELWVEGTLVEPESHSLLYRQSPELDAVSNKNAAGQMAMRRENEKKTQVSHVTESNIILRQQSIASLPPQKQEIKATMTTGSVQTLLQRTPSGVEMTLYLQKLVSNDEIQKASVSYVSEDSLIVTVGTQRIAYRIPRDWQGPIQQTRIRK